MNGTVIDETEGKLTIGVDLGNRSSQWCVLAPDGEVLEQSNVPTTSKAVRR